MLDIAGHGKNSKSISSDTGKEDESYSYNRGIIQAIVRL